MSNTSLSKARKAKEDEYYTRIEDIENELAHYKQHFKGKTVYCNCDDPYESNFFKYFMLKFKELGLKKLIATCYGTSKVAGRQLSLFDEYFPSTPKEDDRKAYKIIVDESHLDGVSSLDDVKAVLKKKGVVQRLDGDGDFRSAECVELLEQADIVVTNPPFSLFREFVALLEEHDKKYLIVGNKNAISYSDIFPYLMEDRMWLGVTSPSNFMRPDGTMTKSVNGLCRWFTNLDIKKRHEPLFLTEKFSEGKYRKFDYVDAINVDKVNDIPNDYFEPMGVPISFMDKYCPEQFEILNQLNRYSVVENEYSNPQGTYGTSVDGKPVYARILIRRKRQ